MPATAASKVLRLLASVAFAAVLLAGCGSSDPDDGGSGPYSIGGSVTGLTGTVVLQINGGETVSRGASGSFSFPTSLASGTAYAVTVQTQPATQNCVVTNGAGTANANVSNVTVACTLKTYTLGGTINGLSGSLVLAEQNEELSTVLTTSGSYQFAEKLSHGDAYVVSVYKQPLGQTCTVASGATGTATADIGNVVVNCLDNAYTVSGTVAGLTSGTSIQLQLNLADSLTATNGAFAFPKRLAAATPFVVSVSGGSLAAHTCTAAGNTGTANANVTNVVFTCTPLAANLPVGGNVQGLSGTVVLRNSLGGETLSLTTNGSYTFPTAVARGTAYAVTVQTQPAGQICTVANANGNVSANSATSTGVNCVAGTETHTVGGTITGLKAPLKIGISLNNTALDVNPANGGGAVSYTFPVPLQFNTEFSVYMLAQPAGQVCLIPHGSSHVAHANITDIMVTCVDNVTDQLSGAYSDAGGNFVLALYGNGAYVFATVDDAPACGASKGSGVEMGVYRYNAAAGTLAFVSNVLDTNGSAVGCGVWQGGASIINGPLVKTGAGLDTVLSLTPTNASAPVPLVPVANVANRPTGSFFVAGSLSFLVLRQDGRYLEANINDDPANNVAAGVEYGCYTAAGTNTGTITPTISTTTCPGAVDTDNTAGLSGAAGTAIPYNSGPGFLIFNGGETVLIRLVPF